MDEPRGTKRVGDTEKPIVITDQQARAGEVSGRVITVLGVSFLLAVISLLAIVAFFWSL